MSNASLWITPVAVEAGSQEYLVFSLATKSTPSTFLKFRRSVGYENVTRHRQRPGLHQGRGQPARRDRADRRSAHQVPSRQSRVRRPDRGDRGQHRRAGGGHRGRPGFRRDDADLRFSANRRRSSGSACRWITSTVWATWTTACWCWWTSRNCLPAKKWRWWKKPAR